MSGWPATPAASWCSRTASCPGARTNPAGARDADSPDPIPDILLTTIIPDRPRALLDDTRRERNEALAPVLLDQVEVLRSGPPPGASRPLPVSGVGSGAFCFLDLRHRICYGARGQDGFRDVTREEERRRAPHLGEVVPTGSPCEQRRTCWGSERLHFAPGPQPFLTGERRRHPQPDGTGGLTHAIPR